MRFFFQGAVFLETKKAKCKCGSVSGGGHFARGGAVLFWYFTGPQWGTSASGRFSAVRDGHGFEGSVAAPPKKRTRRVGPSDAKAALFPQPGLYWGVPASSYGRPRVCFLCYVHFAFTSSQFEVSVVSQ